MEYTFKPMIIPWIAIYFVLYCDKSLPKAPYLFALLFSYIGDLLLMFAWKNDLFFFTGVGGFLVSQILFILAFSKSFTKGKGWIRKYPIWIIPFIAYLAVTFILLYPGLEGIMLPIVVVYALSLVGMTMAAFNRFGKVGLLSFTMVFIGSVFFLTSDTLLAFNRFLDPIPHGGFVVMLTYILAQFMIMMGMIRK